MKLFVCNPRSYFGSIVRAESLEDAKDALAEQDRTGKYKYTEDEIEDDENWIELPLEGLAAVVHDWSD